MKIVLPEKKKRISSRSVNLYTTSTTSQKYHPKYFEFDTWRVRKIVVIQHYGHELHRSPPFLYFSSQQKYRYWWDEWSWNPCSISGTEFTELVCLAETKCNADTAGPSSGRLDEHVKAFPRATR